MSRTRVKTLAKETILANARFFDNDMSKVPTMALTVGVATVMDAKEVQCLTYIWKCSCLSCSLRRSIWGTLYEVNCLFFFRDTSDVEVGEKSKETLCNAY